MGLKRVALAIVCVALIATACSRGDDSSSSSDDATTTTGSDSANAAKSADFGDLKDVCQPGNAKGATAQGVTDSTIRVATFSDRGFTGRPGLNQELFDSGEVFTKWCNDNGGINGRKLQLDLRDTKLTDYKPRILESCRDDFFMVGGGAVFDDTGVEDRLQCMLPDIPGFVVTAKARESDLLLQPLPNEPGALELGDLRWIGKEFPDSTDHVAVLTGDIATTAKVAADDREAVENALGWKVVYDDKYPVTGNVGWTAYVQGLKDKGVKGILWTGEPENLAKFETAMKDANYEVDWIRAATNHYDPSLIETGGDALKNTYVWSSFAPFEEAKDNPAIQDYLEAFKQYAPDAKTKALARPAVMVRMAPVRAGRQGVRLRPHADLRLRQRQEGPRVDRWRAARGDRPRQQQVERLLLRHEGDAAGLRAGQDRHEPGHLQLRPSEERVRHRGRRHVGRHAGRRRQVHAGPQVALSASPFTFRSST